MAAVMGKDGEVRENNVIVALLDSWTINRTIGTAETTPFGSTYETHDPTIRAWTASIAGTLDSTDATQLGIRNQLEDATIANLTFLFMLSSSTAGETYRGTAIIESDSIVSGVKDRINWTANLRGDGELSWAPAT